MLKVIVRGESGSELVLDADPGGKLWDAIQEQIHHIIGQAPEGQPNGIPGKRRGRPPGKNAQASTPATAEAVSGGTTPSDDADTRIV
jgi:hypothetical protein